MQNICDNICTIKSVFAKNLVGLVVLSDQKGSNMGHRQTPEQWLGKDREKVKFVKEYIGRKNPTVVAFTQALISFDSKTTDTEIARSMLHNYLLGHPDGYLMGLNQLRSAWNRSQYSEKHKTVLHSFYLDKDTDVAFKNALKMLKKTKSELISYLLEKELKETSSPVNLVALHQQIRELNLQRAGIEKHVATVFDEINQFVSELRLKEYEYEIVKEKLGTDIDKILEQHSDQIQKFKDSSAKVNILKKIVTRRLKAKSKSKIVPLE